MRSYPVTIEPGRISFDQKRDREIVMNSVKTKGSVHGEIVIKARVSQNQRGYLFGGVIPFVHRIGMYGHLSEQPLTEELVEIYHELLKVDYNGLDIFDGKRNRRVGRSIASIDKDGFDRCLEELNRYVSENFGVPIPTADEFKNHRDTLEDGEFLEEYLKKWKLIK